jgi:uncharacterized protein YciI
MLFAVTCTDRADAGDLRATTRDAHLAWATAKGSPVRMGGPVLDPSGAPAGSLLIVEAEDAEALKAVLAQDPYTRAGLFADIVSMPFKWTLFAPDSLS